MTTSSTDSDNQTVRYCIDNLEADGFHFTDKYIARCTALTTRTTVDLALDTCIQRLQVITNA